MNNTYRMRTDIRTNDCGEECTVYGIEVQQDDRSVRIIRDIFCDAESAEQLVQLCNQLALCPDQLDDVIADCMI